MATTDYIQQAIALLQQALATAPSAPSSQTFGPGTVVFVQQADPFGASWEVQFFDYTAQPNVLHNFTFGGPLPKSVKLGANLTLVVTPPATAGGYSTLVSAS